MHTLAKNQYKPLTQSSNIYLFEYYTLRAQYQIYTCFHALDFYSEEIYNIKLQNTHTHKRYKKKDAV